MKKLLSLRERDIYLVPTAAGRPQVYYLVDQDAGGILINTPPYTDALAEALAGLGAVRYLFFPSHFGAHDVDRWREATGAESLAYGAETAAIAGKIDISLDNKSKLTRTIGFLPMSGRTPGSCALYLRNLPGAIFFGPILAPDATGWPTLQVEADDYSFESRLFGSLGLQDVKYDYAFTDVYAEGETRFGPGADKAIQAALARSLDL
jgi:glyoxylase-like metal-dependent hydrolase (beta-lactamase superfamily II)